jgi:hypothetical protein
VLVLAGIVLFLMFEFGASKIAPPAEDHSWKKRSLAALLLLLATGVSFATADTEWVTLLAGALILGVCLDALAEQPRLIPSIYHPFARRGIAGRIAGRLLYPGWTSGVFFMLLMLVGVGTLMNYQDMLPNDFAWLGYIAFCGAILFPCAIVRLCFPQTQRAVGIFVALQMVLIAITVVGNVLDAALKWNVRIFTSVFPTSAFILAATGSGSRETTELYLVTSVFLTIASFAVLVVLGVRGWRQFRAMEDTSLQLATSHVRLA